MFYRRKQISTQTPFLFANSIEVPALEQQCEEALSKIFRFFGLYTLPSYETINWPPIRAAQFFECGLCGRRWTLGRQYDAPVSRGKCHRTTLGALDIG